MAAPNADSSDDPSLWADARRLIGVAWQVSSTRVAVQMGLLFLVGLIGGASLLLLIPIVNSLADDAGAQTYDIPLFGSIDLSGVPLPVLLCAVVVLTAISAGLQRASTINAEVLEESVAHHLRTRAFDAVLAARWSFVLDRQRSDIITVVATGAERSGYSLGEMLTGAVTLVVALVTAVVALLVEPLLAAIAIAGTLVLGAVLSTSIRRAYYLGDEYSESDRTVHSVMTDSLDSIRLVRAHDAADVWRGELASAFDESRAVQVAYVRHSATLTAASQVGVVISAAILVLVAMWLEVPPPTIVVVLLLVARLARSVQSLASTAQRMAHGLPAVRDIEDLTSAAEAAAEHPEEAGEAVVVAPVPGAPLVALRGVSFRYPSSQGGVSDLTFDLPTGEVTAITGASGAGKSTTADIVLGLLEPDAGDVLIEGHSLTRAGLRAWRARVAYVPQETILIPGSLRRNLLWSVGEADDAGCWSALDRAAAGFARDLPEGLDTRLGDRGIRLSGGERQRVAIARALLREPDLLVLDEATSSLDDVTEAAVLELMVSLGPAVTVLVIAHRRSTIEAAAHVVELSSGRAVGPRG